MMKSNQFATVMVTDPITGGLVEVAMYRHENGGIFGLDASYVDQVECDQILDPLNDIESQEIVELRENTLLHYREQFSHVVCSNGGMVFEIKKIDRSVVKNIVDYWNVGYNMNDIKEFLMREPLINREDSLRVMDGFLKWKGI